MATGSIKIPSTGETTPEYNAVRKSGGEIEPAIIPDEFVRRAHSCGLIPTSNPSRSPLDVVLNEISLDPVNYYSLQHVVGTLNVGNRFDEGIRKMERTFQLEMKKRIPATSSEVEPENCPKVFISFSETKVFGDSPDAYVEAKGLYDELEAQGCKPWMDKKGLEFGDNLAKIFQAIEQCDFIIPIVTSGYATSLWCLRELYYAALQKDPTRKKIIPMLLESEDVIENENAGKWLLSIGTGQKNFKKEEKAAVIKYLKEEVVKKQEKSPHPSNDNLLDGTFQAEYNPVPVNQIDANTNAQASSADQSPQDNFSSANIGTSDQPIASLHSSDQEPHTDTSLQHVQSIELNPDDRLDREAQLRSSADSMKKKFASLLVDAIKDRGIDPDDITLCILTLTEYDDPAIGKPLLKGQKEELKKAKNINLIFDILRPHMTFFNYEILEFLIEKKGSANDQHNLQTFLQEFRNFCRRSVFELPPNTLGHSEEKVVDQQKFAIKITNEFKVALLVQSQEYDQQATLSSPTSSNQEERKRICAPELGISLEDAKRIQRKLALVLKLKPSSIYLDSAMSGCVILTFLLPSHISLAGLDSNPDTIALSDIGIHILCGPPGKPEPKELTSKGLVVQWSRPEYGCSTLIQYVLYYQSKDSETMPLNDWQKIELSSQQTHACVPDLRDGDTYIFRVSSVSDAGTLQYSNESDSILIDVKMVTEESKTSIAQRRLAYLIASIPESNRWKVDKEIDFENMDARGRIIPKHLGRIASDMTDWEDEIADNVGLTRADRADIIERYPRKPSLQRREALSIWKLALGSAATYRALMEVFVRAGIMRCAESVAEILREGAVPTQAGTTVATPGDEGTPPRFSPSMTPDQLEQWLLHEYRSSYKDDISKVKGALINGELFLELPDDKEWLEEFNFSGAFKRLISNKVKKLKESSSVPPVHSPPSFTEGTGPQPPSSNRQASGTYTTAAQAKPAPVSTVLKVTDQLFPNHLQQVLDLVWGARSKYYNIGLGLDLPSGDIDAIASGNSHKPDPVFTEMINKCLRRGLITQAKLAKAVSSQQVGFAYLSDRILAEKFTVPQTPRSAAPGGATSGHGEP